MKHFTKRYNEALSAAHFLAYLIDPCYRGQELTDEKKKTLHFAKDKFTSDFIPMIMKFYRKSNLFF